MNTNKNIEHFKSGNKIERKGNVNDGFWDGKLDKYGKKIIDGGIGPCQPKWGYCIKKSDMKKIGTLNTINPYKEVKKDDLYPKGIFSKKTKITNEHHVYHGEVRKSKKFKNADHYGFKYRYNRSGDYPIKKPKTKIRTLIGYSTMGFIILLWLVVASISAIHSWNEFPANPTWLKLIRTYVAIIFAPIYIFYIFVKTTVFNV